MTKEWTVDQIRAFVKNDYQSVSARMVKCLLAIMDEAGYAAANQPQPHESIEELKIKYAKLFTEVWEEGSRLSDIIVTLNDLFEELKAAAAKDGQAEAMKWINVKDGLPEDKQRVLIFSHAVSPSIYNKGGNEFSRYPNYTEGDRLIHYFFTDVTHWMAFPVPPNKPNQDGQAERMFSLKEMREAFTNCYNTGKVHPGNNRNKDEQQYFKQTFNIEL